MRNILAGAVVIIFVFFVGVVLGEDSNANLGLSHSTSLTRVPNASARVTTIYSAAILVSTTSLISTTMVTHFGFAISGVTYLTFSGGPGVNSSRPFQATTDSAKVGFNLTSTGRQQRIFRLEYH